MMSQKYSALELSFTRFVWVCSLSQQSSTDTHLPGPSLSHAPKLEVGWDLSGTGKGYVTLSSYSRETTCSRSLPLPAGLVHLGLLVAH